MSQVMEVIAKEVLAGASLSDPSIAANEVHAIQWIWDCLKEISEGENMQKIGWTWTNDGTWTKSYVTVPNDVVIVEELMVDGQHMFLKTDNYKNGLKADEYYTDGPVIHFNENLVPKQVKASVQRIKVDDEFGQPIVKETDVVTCRYYILWQLGLIEQRINRYNPGVYYAAKDWAKEQKQLYLKSRRKARGDRNRQTEKQQEMANIEWFNSYVSIRKSWVSRG